MKTLYSSSASVNHSFEREEGQCTEFDQFSICYKFAILNRKEPAMLQAIQALWTKLLPDILFLVS